MASNRAQHVRRRCAYGRMMGDPSPSSFHPGSDGSPPQQVGSPVATLGILLAKVTRIIARTVSSLDPEETFQAALDAIWQVLPAEMVLLRIVPKGANHLVLAASTGLTNEETALLPACLPLDGVNLSARAARTRASLCVALPDALQEDAPRTLWRLGFASIVCLPLLLQDRLLGTLLIGSRRPNAFCPEDVALAEALALIVAPALDRAAVHLRTVQAKARADALAEIGRALTSSLNLEQVLEIIVEKTVAATQSEACGIFRWDAGRAVFVPVAVRGLSARFQQEFAIARHEGLSGAVLGAGQPAWTDDILADPRFRFSPSARELIQAEGFRSVLVVPIMLKSESFGTLVTYRWQPHAFTEDEVRFQSAVADQAAVALENARLFENQREAAALAERQRARAEALAAVGKAISASLELDEVLGLLVERAAVATGADAAAVWERDPLTGTLRCRRGFGLSPGYQGAFVLPAGAGVSGAAIASGKPHWTVEMLTDARFQLTEDTRALIAAEGIQAMLSVPVRWSEGAYGVLNLYWREPRPFPDDVIAFVAQIADQAAIAIENARLYGEAQARLEMIQRQHASAEALLEVSRALTQTLDLEQLFDLIAEKVLAVTGADACGVSRITPAGDLEYVRAQGFAGPSLLHMTLRRGEGLMGRCLEAGAPVWSRDLQSDPAVTFRPERRARVQMRGGLAVPILTSTGPYGVLFIGRRQPHDHSLQEIAFAEGLAVQAGIAIQNARLYAQMRDSLEELAALHAAGQAIAESLDLPETLQRILAAATRLTETDKGIIWLLDEDRHALLGTVVVGLPGETKVRLPLTDPSLAAVCLQEGQVLVSESPEDDPRCNPGLQARFGNKSLIAVPLRSGGQIIGVLDLGDLKRRRGFTPREIGTLERLAQQAVVAIQNARLYAETRKAYDDLRAAQEQLVQVEKLRALGEMAGGVAHDFNNILATVLARAQLLQAQTADPHLRRGLQVIERAALDGAETVRRILGFARARPEARYAPVEIAALLRQVLEVTRPRWKDEAQRRGAAIEAVLAVEPVPAVLGNAAELREVLVNLIFNAVDAMPRGGRLILGARRLLRPGYAGVALNPHRQVLDDRVEETHELVELWMQDTGSGMPEAVRRRAFDPFFTTKGVQGTGLGLSVVYGIIQRHGGEVLLESQETAGTTVIIRLPATTAVAVGAESGAPLAARAARIVVVDDEEVLATALADILRLQRHQVEAFTDPRRALDHVAREPVDLLFTDLGMPDLSGLEMTRQARRLRPNLPVILVTGWGHQVDAEALSAEHVNALLAKPYRMDDVLHVVAEVLPPAPAS